jgi:hypothetical protein
MEPKYQIGSKVIREYRPYLVCGLLAGVNGEYHYGLVPWQDSGDGPMFPSFPIVSLGWATESELKAA